ncbi:hypothetical protein K1720_03255 [Thermococcus argininiproducens]|uniref:Class III signal peptide-containing protein n=1 Tax=Thermococcus argininiproducens TaxID=2866384 RepID=A0A9E7SD70_9EURY|nr:hypothetical protein [Thermococcus argininiproducens]USH00490.1 hypothetical protein K1720_03255 [Thermococcus argininiproducens]
MRISRSKGQTAIEMIFILGILFIGLIMIVPSYTDNNTNIMIVSYVRSSLSKAIDYLNTGVMTDDEPYKSTLNPLLSQITENPHLSIKNFTSEESISEVNITILISTPYLSIQNLNASIVSNLTEFLEKDLVENYRFTNNTGILRYGGKRVNIEIDVVRG